MKKYQGFTLIEVIIAMTILSLILVLLFSTLFTANRSWQSTERKVSQNNELRLVSHFLQRQISQSIPLMWIDKSEQRLIFEGRKKQLRFASTLPAHRGGGGIQIITLKLEKTKNYHQLNLYYQYGDTDSSPFEDNNNIENVTLLEDISNFELSYYGADKVDDTPTWRDEWNNERILPLIVSLKIFEIDEINNWPEIKVPLHSTYINGQPQFVLRRASDTF